MDEKEIINQLTAIREGISRLEQKTNDNALNTPIWVTQKILVAKVGIKSHLKIHEHFGEFSKKVGGLHLFNLPEVLTKLKNLQN